MHALARLPHSSLNCMLSTPHALYAVSSYDPAAEDEAEEDHYYRLHWTVRDGAVVVSSSGWGSGWDELGNDEVLAVDRATGAVSVHALHALRAHRLSARRRPAGPQAGGRSPSSTRASSRSFCCEVALAGHAHPADELHQVGLVDVGARLAGLLRARQHPAQRVRGSSPGSSARGPGSSRRPRAAR